MKQDITGRIFNYLTVIRYSHYNLKSEMTFWICTCVCGKQRIAPSSKLKDGRIKSCGCKNHQHAVSKNRIYDPQTASFRAKASNYKAHAKLDKRKWDLSIEKAVELLRSDCYYCGQKPKQKYNVRKHYSIKLRLAQQEIEKYDIEYNGIDRLDNSKGYVDENVVSACQQCNSAKSIMTYIEFIHWVRSIKSSHFIKNEKNLNLTIEGPFLNQFNEKESRTFIKRRLALHGKKVELTINDTEIKNFPLLNCFYCNKPPSSVLLGLKSYAMD